MRYTFKRSWWPWGRATVEIPDSPAARPPPAAAEPFAGDAFLQTNGGPLTFDEAQALAGIRDTAAWQPLKRMLQGLRSVELSVAMSEGVAERKADSCRGAVRVLTDVEGALESGIREALVAEVARREQDAAAKERADA